MTQSHNSPKTGYYLDNAASTKISNRALEAFVQGNDLAYANSTSVHVPGRTASEALEQARETFKDLFTGPDGQRPWVTFTSGGTEADNLSLLGSLKKCTAKSKREKRIVWTTEIEHSAVFNCPEVLEEHGIETKRIPVDKNGVIDLNHFAENLCKNTDLVSRLRRM